MNCTNPLYISKIRTTYLKHSASGKRTQPAYHTVSMKQKGEMKKLTVGGTAHTAE